MTSSSLRGLSPAFLDELESLVSDNKRGRWWQDVLARPDLFIAVRNEYLNVYYRGASIFLVELAEGELLPRTHAKYLARRQQLLVQLKSDGAFGLKPESALWTSYQGKATLQEMMWAAADLAGPEKIGLHPLLLEQPACG